jgi:hypothetical protein
MCVVDVISIDPRSERAFAESKQRLSLLCSHYVDSTVYRDTIEQISTPSQIASYHQAPTSSATASAQSVSTLKATMILSGRAYVNMMRSPINIITRIMQLMSYGIILCICFLRVGNDQIGVQERQNFLYECLACAFIGLLNAVAMCMSSYRP